MKKLFFVSFALLSAKCLSAENGLPAEKYCFATKTMTAHGVRWCNGQPVFHSETETCTALGVTCEIAETNAATCALTMGHEKVDQFFEDYMPGCSNQP